MRPELRPQDIEVFSEAITQFFSTYTGESASVRSAWLVEDGTPVLWDDYNGVIDIGGDYTGTVCFSAPRAMLSHMLLRMGESVFTDERHGDIVGEIANTLSGRARRHFGEGLDISPPRLVNAGTGCRPRATGSAYAIPLRWHGYEANLVVHIDSR